MEELMKVSDYWTGNSTTTFTCKKPSNSISVYNTGANTLTFQINDITISVPIATAFEDTFDIFNTVTVTATDTYKVIVKSY
jgi:hypothetical protein